MAEHQVLSGFTGKTATYTASCRNPPRTVLATFIAHGSPVLMGYLVLAQMVSTRITVAFPFVPSLPASLPPSPHWLSLRYLDLYRWDRSDWIPTG